MPSLLIAGQPIVGEGPEFASTNPANNAIVWRGSAASGNQVHQAVSAAAQAQESWSAQSLESRLAVAKRYGEILEQDRESLAGLITRETGKPWWESLAEVTTCISKVDLSIRAIHERRSPVSVEVAHAQAEINYRPLGVVIVLGPFNFPAHLPGGQMIPALLAGNAIVFKPSELTPAVGEWICSAWHRAGAPPGVVNLIQGARDVAEAAIDQTNIGGVMFTGSYQAGAAIHRRLAGRPQVLLTLEMGGNNPLVVLPSDELQPTAGAIVASAFVTAGQRCTCARRLIVIDDPKNERLLGELVDRIRRLRVGLPDDDPEPYVGPLISSAAAAHVLRAAEEMERLGGEFLVRPRLDERCEALVHPGLIDMTSAAPWPDEEVFGPLLQVFKVANLAAAIEIANATRFGLAAALLGGTSDDFRQFRDGVRAGVVNWNRQTTGASGSLPFGGLGDSGNHRPVGYWATDACGDPVASLLAEQIRDESFDRMQL